MTLISKSFKRTPAIPLGSGTQADETSNQQQTGLEAEGFSSQDTTLLEMREHARKGSGEGPSTSKKKKANKRISRRGVPMKEVFFSKVG